MFQYRLFEVAAFVIVLSGCLVALALSYIRGQAVASGERLTESFAQVIEEQTTRTFQLADQTLQLATIRMNQMQRAGTLDEQSGQTLLRDELKAMPFARILWVTDVNGQLLYNSLRVDRSINLGRTEYFEFLRAHPQAGFHVSPPVKSRIDGQWLIPVARPLLAADGTFVGTVAAAVDPHYFDKLWKSIDLGAGGSVALFKRDGVLVMRTPFDESVMGKNFQGRPLFQERLGKRPADSYPDTSPIDGQVRLFSYRASSTSSNLVVLVGQSFDEILAAWRWLAGLAMALWLVSCVTVIVLCIILSRAWQHRLATENKLRDSQESLAITLQSIGDAVIATDDTGLITRMNPTAERMTGWPLADALGHPLAEVFHIVNAQTRVPSVNPVQLVMAHGEVVGLANHTALLARDGREYQISDSAAPIRNSAGHIVGVVLVFSDVTEDYRVRQALADTTDMLERTSDLAKVGGWEIDLRTDVTLWSSQTCRMLELDPPVVPATLEERMRFFAPQAHATVLATAQAAIHDGTSWDLDVPMVTAKGRPFWARVQGFVAMEAGKTVKISGTFQDISQHREDIEEIRRLAFYDPLTGLPNRRLLMDRLKQAMITSARTAQHGALMFLDLDHFKLLNDTLGHDVGDVLLQQVAARLQSCVRESDSVARLGGDEFVVLLEAMSAQDNEAATQAEVVANKIRDAFGQSFNPLGHPYDSTPSIGIVMFMGDHESKDDLIKKADVAMYQAKAAGRNTVRFFDPAMQAAVAAHDALEKDMRRGLVQGEFALHYQIQVDGSGTPTGVEALVRWNHPQEGMMSPARFIPLAEETGLILPLGQWVLETACAQLVHWAAHPQTAHLTIAVNVSASQFMQADFVSNVEKALQKTGANVRQLKLELTESTLVNDINDVITKMNAIKAAGVGFSLDDFGTGYSSLAYLKSLPLDHLKIDQSFVRDVLTDPSDAVIARTIVALGHSLGLTVIAEGVETAEQHHFLVGIGCDAYQGYYFGRPVPAEALPVPTSG